MSSLAEESAPVPGSDARCPVCGMFVAPYPQWAAMMELADGTQAWFDGPKDMFLCIDTIQTCLPAAAGKAYNLYVTEYYTTVLTDAGKVFFVEGSDVLGPMGGEMVPVAGEAAAHTFMQDHAGKRLLRLSGKALVPVVESP